MVALITPKTTATPSSVSVLANAPWPLTVMPSTISVATPSAIAVTTTRMKNLMAGSLPVVSVRVLAGDDDLADEELQRGVGRNREEHAEHAEDRPADEGGDDRGEIGDLHR